MGQHISCCCTVDTVSVNSLQDCNVTLQQSNTNTVETHPHQIGGEKVKERKTRSCKFLSLLRRAGKKLKTSSGQGEKEEQEADVTVIPAAKSTDDQTSQHITSSDPEDYDYWCDTGFQDLVGDLSEWSHAVQVTDRTTSDCSVTSSVGAMKPFTGHSEDDDYWCDGSFQDLLGDYLPEWSAANLQDFHLSSPLQPLFCT